MPLGSLLEFKRLGTYVVVELSEVIKLQKFSSSLLRPNNLECSSTSSKESPSLVHWSCWNTPLQQESFPAIKHKIAIINQISCLEISLSFNNPHYWIFQQHCGDLRKKKNRKKSSHSLLILAYCRIEYTYKSTRWNIKAH